eukprot:g4038.t1
MKDKTLQNLKSAVEFKKKLHKIQKKVFEAYARKILIEFLETEDGKLAIRRIDKVLVPMAIKATSMVDIPIVEDSILNRTSKFPLYVNERIKIARNKLELMHENNLESLYMIQAEANAQLQAGTSIVQLYTMSETVLHKIRGNVITGNDIIDAAFHSNHSDGNDDTLRVDLVDIISDARRQQQLYQEKLKRELTQMNILIRMSDERREKYHNFDADEDTSAKLYLGDNLAKDMLPEGIIVQNNIYKNKIQDNDDQVEQKLKNAVMLSNSPSSNDKSKQKHGKGNKRMKKQKRESMILISLKDEVKVDKPIANVGKMPFSAFSKKSISSTFNDSKSNNESDEQEKIALELKIEYMNSMLLSLNKTRAKNKKELETIQHALSKWNGISTENLPKSIVAIINRDEKHKKKMEQGAKFSLKKFKNSNHGSATKVNGKSIKQNKKDIQKGYALNSNLNHHVHKHRKMFTPSKVISAAKREIITKHFAATIIQKLVRGVLARNYLRLVRARIENARLQRQTNDIQTRAVLKVVSKMRLFVKRKRAAKKLKKKQFSNEVANAAKVRNFRVEKKKILLQHIAENAATKAKEMKLASQHLNNNEENNHVERALKQRRQSLALIKQSAKLVAERAAEKSKTTGNRKAIFMDAVLGGKKRNGRLQDEAERQYLETHKSMLKNAENAAKLKQQEAEIAEKLLLLRKDLNSSSSDTKSNIIQAASLSKDTTDDTLRKGTRVEVSLPCPGRSNTDVLTGFITEDANVDPSMKTYDGVVELKICFDDGLTSNVPKNLVRVSTAPLPFTPPETEIVIENEGLLKYIDSLWHLYDTDGSNHIDIVEVRKLIMDLTNHHVSEDHCRHFVNYIESQFSENEPNGEIEKEELMHFLEAGMEMDTKERAEFALRGTFQSILVHMFDTVEKAMKKLNDLNNVDGVEKEEQPQKKPEQRKVPSIAAPPIPIAAPVKQAAAVNESEETPMKKDVLKLDPSDENLVEKIFKQSFGKKQNKSINSKKQPSSPFSQKLTDEELKARDEADRNSFIDRIWSKYDHDGNGDLDASEMKRLIDRFTGEKVSVENVESFLKEIDQDGDALIQKEELREFVTFGLTLSKESREQYGAKGPLQKIIVKFFYGLDGAARIHAKEQRAIERQRIQEEGLMAQKKERMRQKRLLEIRRKQNQEREIKSKPPRVSFFGRKKRGVSLMKHKPTEDEVPESETVVLERAEFINFVWKEYDKDGSGQIDANETKQLLEDFTGHAVSRDDVIDFLSSIDDNGDALIQKLELMDFINTGIKLTEEERQEYAARGPLHSTIVEFFYGVDRERKAFAEQKKRAMKAAEDDMNKVLEDRRRRYKEASARSKSPEAISKKMKSRTPSPKTSKRGEYNSNVGDYVEIQLPYMSFKNNDKTVGVVVGIEKHGARNVRIDTFGVTGAIESNTYMIPREKAKVIDKEDYDGDILLLPYGETQNSSAINFSIKQQKYQNVITTGKGKGKNLKYHHIK